VNPEVAAYAVAVRGWEGILEAFEGPLLPTWRWDKATLLEALHQLQAGTPYTPLREDRSGALGPLSDFGYGQAARLYLDAYQHARRTDSVWAPRLGLALPRAQREVSMVTLPTHADDWGHWLHGRLRDWRSSRERRQRLAAAEARMGSLFRRYAPCLPLVDSVYGVRVYTEAIRRMAAGEELVREDAVGFPLGCSRCREYWTQEDAPRTECRRCGHVPALHGELP
jgi:hypothetical protein